MTRSEEGTVEHQIKEIFREELELDVGVDDALLESGVLDSLGFVRLLVALERRYGLSVDVAALDLTDFSTVGSIARMVTAHAGASS